MTPECFYIEILFDEDEGEMSQEIVDGEVETGYGYRDTEEWDQINEEDVEPEVLYNEVSES